MLLQNDCHTIAKMALKVINDIMNKKNKKQTNNLASSLMLGDVIMRVKVCLLMIIGCQNEECINATELTKA